jgi:zinc protease
VPKPVIQAETPRKKEKQLKINGPGGTTYIQIAYRAPAGNDPDFMPYSVADSLLSGPTGMNMFGGGSISNKTSRLYRALVEKNLAVGIGGGIQATVDPFLYILTITVNPRYSPDTVLAAFDQEIDRVLEQAISQKEVDRSIKQARALFAYGSESITNQAFWLGYSEMFAHYDWFLTYLDRLAAVTPGEVLAVCQKYLRRNSRVVGIYQPNTGGIKR